jgi:hypothetical protein
MEVVQALSDKLGPEVAAALMECVPPFPWTELPTKRDLAQLEARMELRFDAMDARFAALEARVDGRLDRFEGRLGGFEGRLEGFEGRLEGFEGRLEGFEGRLEGFEGRITALIQEKLSAQNRTLRIAAVAAILAIVLSNVLR